MISSCSRSNHRFRKNIQPLLATVHPLCGYMHVVRPSVYFLFVFYQGVIARAFENRDRDRVKRQNGVVTNITARHKITRDNMSKMGPKLSITETHWSSHRLLGSKLGKTRSTELVKLGKTWSKELVKVDQSRRIFE